MDRIVETRRRKGGIGASAHTYRRYEGPDGTRYSVLLDKVAEPPNPWGLSPGEARAMDAICKHGTQEAAARSIHVCVGTLRCQLQNAGKRMPQAEPLLRYIAWALWRNG